MSFILLLCELPIWYMYMEMYEEHFSSYFRNFKVKVFGLRFEISCSKLIFFLFNWIGFKRKLYIKMMSRSQPTVLLDKIGSTSKLMTFIINIYLLGLIWVILWGHWGEILVEAPRNGLILFGHPPGINILPTPVLCHLFGNQWVYTLKWKIKTPDWKEISIILNNFKNLFYMNP